MSHTYHTYLPNYIMPYDGVLLFVLFVLGTAGVALCFCPWNDITGRQPRQVYVVYRTDSDDEEV